MAGKFETVAFPEARMGGKQYPGRPLESQIIQYETVFLPDRVGVLCLEIILPLDGSFECLVNVINSLIFIYMSTCWCNLTMALLFHLSQDILLLEFKSQQLIIIRRRTNNQWKKNNVFKNPINLCRKNEKAYYFLSYVHFQGYTKDHDYQKSRENCEHKSASHKSSSIAIYWPLLFYIVFEGILQSVPRSSINDLQEIPFLQIFLF